MRLLGFLCIGTYHAAEFEPFVAMVYLAAIYPTVV